MVRQLSKEYKRSPEYKLINAVYKNWRLAVPGAIERGINLKQYIDFAETYDAIKPTDSETYTKICEYFVNANLENLKFVDEVKFKLNKSQMERINTAALDIKRNITAKQK